MRKDPHKRSQENLVRQQKKEDMFFGENNIISYEQFLNEYKTKLSFDGYFTKTGSIFWFFLLLRKMKKKIWLLKQKLL